jgi:peptidyl-prolyl cis-trans isomerase C
MRFCLALTCAGVAHADTVIKDDEVRISRDEMQQIVRRWTPEMRAAAANDAAARWELAAMNVASKKIARAAGEVTPESDPEFYWEITLQVRQLLRNLMIQHYLDTLAMPDWEPLARERYLAEKDKYALVPERRLSSHILFACQPGNCDNEKVVNTAEETLVALRNGGEFSELVTKYSDDTVSKVQGGQVSWMSPDEPGVDGKYREAIFAIEKVGAYSGVISTKFGLHIIRLDDIEAPHYKTYEEVKDQIIAHLEAEYKKLAAVEFDKKYGPAGTLVLTEDVLDEVLAPYRTPDAAVAAPSEQTKEDADARTSADTKAKGD